MVFLEVRVAPRGKDRDCRGPKPKSSASFKEDRSNDPSAQIPRRFIAPGFSIVTLQAARRRATQQKMLASVLRYEEQAMIRKLKSGQYRLYSRKKDAKTGRRKNLGTFSTREAAEQHEREVQYFKRH